MQSTALPGDIGTINFPDDLVVEMEDEQTLLAYSEDSDAIALRVSSISFSKSGDDAPAAREFVRRRAEEKGSDYYEVEEKGVTTYAEESSDEKGPLLIRYWEVGTQNSVVIVSATIVEERSTDQSVQEILHQIPALVESIDVNTFHRTIEVDGEIVESVVQSVESTPQTITPFGEEEETWLKQSFETARELSLYYGSGGELNPEELDRVFSRWTADNEPNFDAVSVVDGLGAAFGEYLVDTHEFCWVVVDDEYGTIYAVRHNETETIAYPTASVEKRIDDGITEFFIGLYHVILDQQRRMRE